MFLSEEFFVFFTTIAEVGNNGKTKLLDLNRILLSLKELKQVVNDTFFTDFYFILLFE